MRDSRGKRVGRCKEWVKVVGDTEVDVRVLAMRHKEKGYIPPERQALKPERVLAYRCHCTPLLAKNFVVCICYALNSCLKPVCVAARAPLHCLPIRAVQEYTLLQQSADPLSRCHPLHHRSFAMQGWLFLNTAILGVLCHATSQQANVLMQHKWYAFG